MKYDLIVIGGGFYGLRIAAFARADLGMSRVAVLEKEPELMNRASYVNQARVHNGYHYPRSLLTAFRSQVNFPTFVNEYGDAVVDNFEHHYAIARQFSKVNARQFEIFCGRIGAAIRPARSDVAKFFNPRMIEGVYTVQEPAFDSRILREIMLDRIEAVGGIDIFTSTEAQTIDASGDGVLRVSTASAVFEAPQVLSAVYSRINTLHRASGLPELPLQHEVTDMALVQLPDALAGHAFTVMDGPFFSMMPFPSRGAHTLSHVRYTPKYRWHDSPGQEEQRDPHDVLTGMTQVLKYDHMYADVVRYMPAMAGMVRQGSLSEVKTVLTRSELNDSRPILFRADHGVTGYTCIMGGKLDNIYDVLEELTLRHGQTS